MQSDYQTCAVKIKMIEKITVESRTEMNKKNKK